MDDDIKKFLLNQNKDGKFHVITEVIAILFDRPAWEVMHYITLLLKSNNADERQAGRLILSAFILGSVTESTNDIDIMIATLSEIDKEVKGTLQNIDKKYNTR